MSEEGSKVSLVPRSSGRWTLITPDSGKASITIPESTKRPPIGEDLPSAAFASFVPVSEGEKILIQPKLAHDWGRFSQNLKDDKVLEIQKLMSEYSGSLKKMIEAGDPQFYQASTATQNSEFERLMVVLRQTLLEEAGRGETPALKIAAARTLISSYDRLQADEQGLARGMSRVSSRATEDLKSAAYGVAEVIAGEATIGVCTRTADAACVTAAHVVKNYASSPGALKVRFHVKGDQGTMVSVTVPVSKVAIRENWSPLTLKDNARANAFRGS